MPDFSKGSKPTGNRVPFEMTENTSVVVENEYCKICTDKRSGKTFKVINNEIVPIELRELNMWKNRQRNPDNFNVNVVKDYNGSIVDYEISRVSQNGATAAQARPSNAPSTPPTAPKPDLSKPISAVSPSPINPPVPEAPKPAPIRPPVPEAAKPAPIRPSVPEAPKPAPIRPPVADAATPAPKAVKASQPVVTNTVSAPKPSRIKFEMTPTTELVLKNEFFELYKDTRSGKTFKVIDGEVAPVELRELNMWKNHQKNPSNFAVEVIKGQSGEIYDYSISRASAAAEPVAEKSDEVPVPAPVDTAPKPAPQRPAIQKPVDAPVDNAKPQQRKTANVPSVTYSTGTPPTDRIKFEMTPTTEVVVENEFCKFYKDTRSGKTFKVINDMVAPIELRELNMWKNRQKNPRNFTVDIIKDSNGTPFDYIISRINEDGTLTKAPAVAPVAPYVPPENEYVPTMTAAESKPKPAPAKPSQVFPVGKPEGALPVTESKEKGPSTDDRIPFEETPTMTVVLENELFKIYNDSRRGKTFKVIDGKISPVELREVNMWKNRQRKAKNFAVEIIRTESGALYDYKITRTEKSTTADVESTSTKTNMPPVTTLGNSAVAKKRRPNSSKVSKCAICGNEYNDSELLLFNNHNFCSSCVEQLVKEKLDFKPVDPIQKIIDDVVAADELYCTYSTVTNYPHLDDEFCVNVCTVKRAAELSLEDTAVQTIDDKGIFFDDLKRFGLKKIIINNNPEHIFAPEDFDEHIKTEGVIAPKLYFKILNFMQKKDDELRAAIAASFMGSKVYTYALNDDITEITDENIDDFKPMTITDGYVNFCPVFTDFTEVKSVGMPFRGLYEIETRLLVKYNITHFIINPSSLGFIMNKSILKGVVPNYDRDLVPIGSEITDSAENITDNTSEINEEEAKAVEEQVEFAENIVAAAEPEVSAEPMEVIADVEPIETNQPVEPLAVDATEPVNSEEHKSDSPEIVVKSDNGDGTSSTKTFKVSMPIFIPDDPNADIETNINSDSSVQKAIKKATMMMNDSSLFTAKPLDEPISSADSNSDLTEKESSSVGFDDFMSDFASSSDDSLDLGSLIMSQKEEPEPPKPKISIQRQATEAKVIAKDLEIEHDLRVAQILREQLNESYRKLFKMIAEADVLYAEFDSNTKHILIDGNNKGHIFSEKEFAEKSVENFAKIGVDVFIKEYSNGEIFDLIFEYKRHGIQDLVLDETANWVIVSTDTIIEALDVDERKHLNNITLHNPELMFAMTTLFQKLQSKAENPNRKQEVASLEKLMIREFTSARYLLPLIEYSADNVRPLTIEGKNGVRRVVVFSDVFEMKRFFGDKISLVKDYEIMTYRELIKRFTVIPNTVVVLNEGSLRFEFNDHNCDHINKVMNQ